VRIIRALEIELKKEKEKVTPLPYLEDVDIKIVGLTARREFLYTNADTWADKIWENGLVAETKRLLEMGYANTPKLNGLIYKTAVQYIKNQLSEEHALERIRYDLHAYIRRQQTYFKKMKNVQWYNVIRDDFKEKIYTLVNG
jgi:tRNA dimethylallyltransferase